MLIGNDEYLSEEERNKFEKNILKRQKEILEEKQEENLHNEMQYHLLKIGVSLGFDVTPAPMILLVPFLNQSTSISFMVFCVSLSVGSSGNLFIEIKEKFSPP